MERVHPTSQRHSLWWGVLLLALAACGEAEEPVAPADRLQSQAEYTQRLDALPDTVLATMTRLDSLFLSHDLAALQPPPFDSTTAMHWVDSLMGALTLEEKIGQLFIVHLPVRDLRQLVNDDALEAVKHYHVGGFLVPRQLGPRQVFNETQRLQREANVPLFFAADYERGVGQFNNAFTELPSNMALGATRDTVLAAAAGRLTALESRALGVNLLLAPVVDVNTNAANPIINIRSYGEDPALVGAMASSFVREAQAHGVLTTLKHFPGHGGTAVDSHTRLDTVKSDVAALDSIELRPYREVLGGPAAPAGVMSAHLWVQALDATTLPATFSERILGDLLRDSLGFQGVIMTDNVQMGALRTGYSLEERVVRPLQARADILLIPEDLGAAVGIIRAALRQGTLDEGRIDTSVHRILRAKAQARLARHRFAREQALAHLQEKPRGAYLAQTVADEAITLLKTAAVLPLEPDTRVALVQLANIDGAKSVTAAMDFLAAELSPAADLRPTLSPSREAEQEVLQHADSADVVVVALYQRLLAGRGEAGLFPAQARLVSRLVEAETPVVVVTFGNPYAVAAFSSAEALLVAYDQALESVHAVVRVLQGRHPPQGRLPVTVPPFEYGSGLQSIGH